MKNEKFVIILPCYNEEEVVKDSAKTLLAFLEQLTEEGLIAPESGLCFLNDGSRDNTWELIEQICAEDARCHGIKLSTNFGHQYALLAGMERMSGKFDIYLTMDVDLQDDLNAIREMLLKRRANGTNIIFGVRTNRDTDSWFKRTTAQGFYKLMQFWGVKVISNHADFRFFDQKVLNHLLTYRERNLFLRGLFTTLGFKTDTVCYTQGERMAGHTKYNLRKMLNFAFDGATSMSTRPIKMVLTLGIFSLFVAFVILFYALISLVMHNNWPGWVSTIFIIVFFGGVQMLSIGIIGEYIGKIYKEVKQRPRYIIEDEK